MPSEITTVAIEQSSFGVQVTFKDVEGTPFTPSTLTWSLVDRNSIIINNREDVVVATPTNPYVIALTGADLAKLTSAYPEERWVVLEGTYDSTLGNGIPFRDQVKITVVDLKKVPN